LRLALVSRCARSAITGKTLPDLISSLLKRVKSSMKAFVVKVKHIANDYQPEKPGVTFQVAKNLLGRTTEEGNEPQQEIHLNQLPRRVALEQLRTSYL
jgi:hypothetical protein